MVIETIPPALGFGYALIVFFLLVWLWSIGKFTRKIGFIFLVISTALGFLLFSPVAPYQLQLLILMEFAALGVPVQMIFFGLCFFIGFTILFGRIFCGHICPIGTLQELLFLIPLPKYKRNLKSAAKIVRILMFILILVAGIVFSVNILGLLGVKDFFYLNVAGFSFFVFSILVILALIIYRPFCRFICPYGFFLSLATIPGLFQIARTDLCINCGKCEQNCPTDEAKQNDNKAECYMCGRCMEICPVRGALVYQRRNR